MEKEEGRGKERKKGEGRGRAREQERGERERERERERGGALYLTGRSYITNTYHERFCFKLIALLVSYTI